MKQIFKFSTLLFLIFHGSCISTHNGFIQSPSFSVKNNFKIVSTIEGKSKATYILGIGGNLREGLVNEAKKNMYSKYLLNANQNLTNITVDIKRTFFILPIFFMRQNVIVSADIIEFYDNFEVSNSVGNRNPVIDKLPQIKEDKSSSSDIKNNNNLSPIYTKLQSIKNDMNVKVVDYKTLSDVKVGDFVQAETSKGEFLYGEVIELLSMNELNVRLEPTPQTIVYNVFDFKKCKKVIVN
jgi:nucleoside-specific outer membrane channel protein Tsx